MGEKKCLMDLSNLVRESKHPRVIYLREQDFIYARDRAGLMKSYDNDGEFVMLMTTKIRPAIRILDLSDSTFFE